MSAEKEDSIFESIRDVARPRENAKVKAVTGTQPAAVAMTTVLRSTIGMPFMRFICVTARENMVDCMFCAEMRGTKYIFAHVYVEAFAGKNTVRFACFGTPYVSQDGEYRSHFVTWSQVKIVLAEFAPLYDRLERSIAVLMRKIPIKLSTIGDESTVDIAATRLFCFWMHSAMLLTEYRGREPHAVPAGEAFIWDKVLRGAWSDVISSIRSYADGHTGWTEEKHGMESSIREMLGCSLNESRKLFSGTLVSLCHALVGVPVCGQKLIPLTDLEWENRGDINYSAWRELYIANICSNLVIDRIACGFAFIGGWFYLRNMAESVFMNPAIHERFRNSMLAERMMDDIHDADELNYSGREGRQRAPINARFARMSRKLIKAFEYARGNIHFSGNTVCAIFEDVGMTWGTMIRAYFSKPLYKPLMDKLGALHETLFMDILWSFDTMNKQLGVIHADCHINNVTIAHSVQSVTGWFDDPRALRNEHTVAYDFGEGNVFCANFTRLSAYVIDFSRALIFDMQRIEREFSHRYAEIFAKNQRDRIMATIAKYLPEFIQDHKYVIEARILSNLADVGTALSAVDPYHFFGGLSATLDNFTTERRAKNGTEQRQPFDISGGSDAGTDFGGDDADDMDPVLEAEHLAIFDKISVIANKISTIARDVLVANMRALINGNFAEIRWANEVIFIKVFSKHRMTDPAGIVDAYSVKEKVVSDIREIGLWPREVVAKNVVDYIEMLAGDTPVPPIRKTIDDNAEISQWLRKYNVGADSTLARLAESSWM